MRRHSLLVAIAVGMSVIPFSSPGSRSASPPVPHLAASHALRFEANQGQFDSRVDFVARGGGSSISFTERGALISSSNRSPFEIHLAGGRAVHPVGSSLSLTKTNYFIGNDPTRWRTDVPNFERVVYPSILDGVDLVFHGTNGRLEYDIVVAPNADPRLVAIDLDGRRGQLSDGNLVIATPGADVVQARPVAYQVDATGTRLPVDAEFALEGGRVRFELGPYERSLPLVIDPVLLSSTFEGGSGSDDGFKIAADATGVYVVGESLSPNFPVVGSLQSWAGDDDVVVTKLNPTGSAVTFATYIGGGNFDSPNAVAVDNSGAIYVGGESNSFNFPVVSALQPTNAGGLDGFLTKLSPSGNALVFSTYLGGSDTDVISSMAVDAGGSIFVGGASLSTGLATAGVAQASFAGGTLDGFIA
ncbi:MAG TPA: SBBP repeat-containing protein, partial [Polyangiaceae bacterium]